MSIIPHNYLTLFGLDEREFVIGDVRVEGARIQLYPEYIGDEDVQAVACADNPTVLELLEEPHIKAWIMAVRKNMTKTLTIARRHPKFTMAVTLEMLRDVRQNPRKYSQPAIPDPTYWQRVILRNVATQTDAMANWYLY